MVGSQLELEVVVAVQAGFAAVDLPGMDFEIVQQALGLKYGPEDEAQVGLELEPEAEQELEAVAVVEKVVAVQQLKVVGIADTDSIVDIVADMDHNLHTADKYC